MLGAAVLSQLQTACQIPSLSAHSPALQPFGAGPPQPTALGRAAAAGDFAVVTSDVFAAEAAAAGMTPDQYLAYQEDLVMQEVLAVS